MKFDPENKIVKLCAEGISLEGQNKLSEAISKYSEAWQVATDYFERFTAAHYMARGQKSVLEKLKWDEIALGYALKIEDNDIKGSLPSLYLNIAKCHEDLGHIDKARGHYNLAKSLIGFLPNNGYGDLIKEGIHKGLLRVSQV